jgi:light-regulated signal transduction histidine kinase (bacteriophytochrome)
MHKTLIDRANQFISDNKDNPDQLDGAAALKLIKTLKMNLQENDHTQELIVLSRDQEVVNKLALYGLMTQINSHQLGRLTLGLDSEIKKITNQDAQDAVRTHFDRFLKELHWLFAQRPSMERYTHKVRRQNNAPALGQELAKLYHYNDYVQFDDALNSEALTKFFHQQGYQNYLMHILSVYIDNALHWRTKGSHVTVQLQDATNGETCFFNHTKHNKVIVVRNEGAPLPDATKKALFHQTRSTRYEGNGVGLMLCKCIAKMLGFSVYYDHEHHYGQTHNFIVSFDHKPIEPKE